MIFTDPLLVRSLRSSTFQSSDAIAVNSQDQVVQDDMGVELAEENSLNIANAGGDEVQLRLKKRTDVQRVHLHRHLHLH